jgi:hypothetical protein
MARSSAVLTTSAVAACIGYLTADPDFLGRELDPSVLRTYVLVGFLSSYFGLEMLLSGRLSGSTSSPKPLEQVALKPGNRKNE